MRPQKEVAFIDKYNTVVNKGEVPLPIFTGDVLTRHAAIDRHATVGTQIIVSIN